MREYKFRAWIPEVVDIKTNSFVENTKNKMVYSGELFYELSRFWGMLNANSIIVDGLYIPFQSEVMQYTGIKDDDGTEICEGDIIRHYHKNRISESYETFIVKFGEYNNNMTYEDYVEGVGFYLYDIITGDVEIFCNHKVIGNIYENPELLGEYK